jgi:hypothetical protein
MKNAQKNGAYCRSSATNTIYFAIQGNEFEFVQILRVLSEFVDWITQVIVMTFTFLQQLFWIMFDQSQLSALTRTIPTTINKASSISFHAIYRIVTNNQAHTSIIEQRILSEVPGCN